MTGMKYAKITGTGSYLPKEVLKNADLEKMVDTSHEWIVERTGIHERRIASEDETAATMAHHAAEHALKMAGISAKELDLIIVSTSTSEYIYPSTACLIQESLGAGRCPAFDIQAACAGFLYALHIANQYVRAGAAKHVLIVGSEVNSRLVDWKDRSTCVIFGDGAGAAVLSASDEPGILCTDIHSDGQYEKLLYVRTPYGKPIHVEPSFIQMEGSEVFRFAVNVLGEMVTDVLAKNNIEKSQVDWFIPHQANLRIINALAKRIELPIEQVIITLDKQGNTSSASIPLALDQAIRDGRIGYGHLVLLEAFGGGFTWGSALVRM